MTYSPRVYGNPEPRPSKNVARRASVAQDFLQRPRPLDDPRTDWSGDWDSNPGFSLDMDNPMLSARRANFNSVDAPVFPKRLIPWATLEHHGHLDHS